MKRRKDYLIDLDQSTFEQIEKFLLGQMSEVENADFQAKMADNPMLKNEVELQQKLMATIQVDSAIAQNSEEQNYPNLAKISFSKSKKIHKLFVPLIGVAAGVILVAVVGYFWITSSQDLFTKYYIADPGLATEMGVSKQFQFQDAMVDYKMQNYQTAKDTWQVLSQENADNDTINYYIAMADLNLKNYEIADQKLDLIPSTSAFYADALWYQSLIAVKNQNWSLAKSKLQQIDSPQAKELLDKIQTK